MRTIQNIMGRILAFMAVCTASVAWISCSSDLEETPASVPHGEEQTAVMHLEAGKPSYAGKRAASAEWNEGDVVYLRFYQADGATVICGKATYSAATSLWSVSYYGNLATGNTYKCEAFYFTDATAEDNFNITMTPTSCAYEDLAASYLVDGGELFVTASLSPKTARMRFMGTAGQKISVQKIVYHTTFNLKENSYATSSEQVDLQVGEDGYTPYMYGSLEESNEITVRDIYYEYTKTFDPAKFAPGESGYITMPSQVENKGWSQTYYYPENAIDLGLSVRWAKTNVGASISTNSGIFCAWGDPEGTYNLTSTNYNRDVSEIAGNPEYDIATNLWNERWQIPTKEQWQELIDECTWEYQHDSDHNLHGYLVTGTNGNSIYLPMYNYIIGTNEPGESEYPGYYWSSTEQNDYHAYCMYLYTSSHNVNNYEYKYYRMLVRPVLAK